MKKHVCVSICIALIVLFTAPFAFGQALDGLWFKANVTYKGYTVDGSGLLTKTSGKFVNYLNFTWDDVNYDIACYDEDGNIIYTNQKATLGANEELIDDLGMSFGNTTDYIETYQAPLIKIKRDRAGTLKSVTINSMGCEAHGGPIDGNQFYGGCTMKAKTIEAPPFPL